MAIACERRSEVETEAIDVRVEHPIAEAVHDHLEHARMHGVNRVPGFERLAYPLAPRIAHCISAISWLRLVTSSLRKMA